MQDILIDKQTILDALRQSGYNAENYPLGIKIHMNDTQYIDISRLPGHQLALDVYTNGKLDPNSLAFLEDHGRIRSVSLICVLEEIEHNFMV